jgi:hypothetical protein
VVNGVGRPREGCDVGSEGVRGGGEGGGVPSVTPCRMVPNFPVRSRVHCSSNTPCRGGGGGGGEGFMRGL